MRGLSRTRLVLTSTWLALSLGPPGWVRAEEPSPLRDDAAFEGVEEVEVWGVQPGRLPVVLGASTDQIDIDDFTAEGKTVTDLLSETEGVTVRRFGGPGDSAEVSIRGSSPSQVVVTVDGVKANSILTGGLDLSRLCTPLLDRIEITRGAGAGREGSGAVGGVVNLVSRAGSEKPTTRAAFEAGAFETYSGSLLESGSAGSLDYTLGYCGFSTEGDFKFARPIVRSDGFEARFQQGSGPATRLNNDRVQHGANVGLAHDWGRYRLRLIDLASYASGGEPGVDLGIGPTAGQSIEARSRDLSNLLQLRVEGPSPTGWGDAFSLAAYHRFERARFRNPAVPRFVEPIDADTRLMTGGVRARDLWSASLGPLESETRWAIDFAHDVLRGETQRGRERPTVAGGIEERLGLASDRVLISGGLRVDWTEGFDPRLVPSAGLVLDPLPWLRLRAHAERGYRAPNFDELFHPDEGFLRGNPNLSPEDAWNFDGGVEIGLDRLGPLQSIGLRASGFYREIDESIIWVLSPAGVISPINTGPATAQGFELSFRAEWTRFFGATFNYTWTDSERKETGRRLAGQAEFELFARLRIGPKKHWKLVAEVQNTGEILVNEGGGRFLPERTVWNASAAIDLARFEWLGASALFGELWLYAALDNMTDEAVRDAVSFPQPGRNASAGLEARW